MSYPKKYFRTEFDVGYVRRLDPLSACERAWLASILD